MLWIYLRDIALKPSPKVPCLGTTSLQTPCVFPPSSLLS